MRRSTPSPTEADGADNVIAFPADRARPPAQAEPSPPGAGVDADTLALYAASAGTVAAEAIVDMIDAAGRSHTDVDADGDHAIAFGLLWGAVLGIAARHGQMAALDALDSLLEEVRADPYRYLVEQRERIDTARDLKSRTGNVLGALMVESHPGPYVTGAGE